MGGRMGAGGGGTRRGRWAPRRGAQVLGGARGRRRAIANDTARRAKKQCLFLYMYKNDDSAGRRHTLPLSWRRRIHIKFAKSRGAMASSICRRQRPNADSSEEDSDSSEEASEPCDEMVRSSHASHAGELRIQRY